MFQMSSKRYMVISENGINTISLKTTTIHMNWLRATILAIPVMDIFKGFQKVMVKMAVSFLSVFITLAACFSRNPHIERVLKQETRIYAKYPQNNVNNSYYRYSRSAGR